MEKGGASAILKNCLDCPVPTLSSLSPDKKDGQIEILQLADVCRLFG